MRVTSPNDHVESAIISKNQTHEMGITDNAEFFQLLSATLYSDQALAVIREVLCNAWDAHIEAGVEDTPIKITLNNDYLVIQDFGYGIPKKDFVKIYGIYGESTKKTDEGQTGGFGLGCKSPFAYTDHFQVTSIHDGVKTLYNCSKTSSEVYGKPGITEILSQPFTEYSGVTVKIKIKTSEDKRTFEQNIYRVVRNAEMNATLNDVEIDELLPLSQSPESFIITNQSVSNNFERVYIRYGSVIYPVPSNKEYDDDLGSIHSLLSSFSGCSIIFQTPPNSINVVPSREQLSNNGVTVTTLSKIFREFISQIHSFDVDLVWEYQKSLIDKAMVEKRYDDLFKELSILEAYPYQNGIFDFNQIALRLSSIRYPKQIAELDVNYRVDSLLRVLDKVDSDSLNSLRKAIFDRKKRIGKPLTVLTEESHNPSSYSHRARLAREISKWFYRFKIKPAINLSQKYEVINQRNFSIIEPFGYSRELVDWKKWLQNARHLPFLNVFTAFESKVVLTHGPRPIKDEWHHRIKPQFMFDKPCAVMVYTVPRRNKTVNEVRDAFKDAGIEVIDLLTLRDNSKARNSARKSGPRISGMIALTDMHITDHSAYPTNSKTERQYDKIKDPDCFIWGDDLVTGGVDQYGPHMARMVRLYGQNGAFCRTPAQKQKCLDAGLPTLTEYSRKNVLNLFLKDNFFREIILKDKQIFASCLHNLQAFDRLNYQQAMFVQHGLKSDKFKNLLKLPTPIETLDDFYADNLKLFKQFYQHELRFNSSSVGSDDENLMFQKVKDTLNKKLFKKPFLDFIKKCANSPLVQCLDLSEVSKNMDDPKVVRLFKYALKG